MKKYFLLILCFGVIHLFAQTADSSREYKEHATRSTIKDTPLFIIDNVVISMDSLKKINPNDIADLTVLKDSNATALYGTNGTNGVIIAETKPFAKRKYINLLKTYSGEYSRLYKQKGDDSLFQYILDEKVLTTNCEGELSLLSNQKIVSIQILTKKQLENKYNINNKEYGIVICSEKKNANKKNNNSIFNNDTSSVIRP